MFWGEITNPFFIMMKKYRVEDNQKMANFHQNMFALVYLFARGHFIPKLTLEVQLDLTATPIFRILFGFAYFISVVWLLRIVNMASKELATVRIFFIWR